MGGLPDFLVRAALGGLLLAAITGPLGSFVVWRRLSYFGDTMAHSALLGVTMSIAFRIDITLGIFAVAAGIALLMNAARSRVTLPTDALLGLLSHAALATGLVILSFVRSVRIDLMSFLFGDILALSQNDLMILAGTLAVVGAVLLFIWRPLLADTVSTDLAAGEGMPTRRARILFVLLLAATIAAAIKLVGVLLITAMLIIPASSARMLARGPEGMAVLAIGFGGLAVIAGLWLSLAADTPAGPSIVMAAAVLFLVVTLASLASGRAER